MVACPPVPKTAPYDVDALAARLLQRRKVLGWSQAETAANAGLSAQYISLLESGSVNPSIEKLARLAHALGVSLGEIVTGDAPWPVVSALRERDGREAVEAAVGRGIAERGVRIGTRVALLGIRGAGKSTVGAAVARALEVPFVELDALVEARLGLSLGQVFELQGDEPFVKAQAEVLAHLLGSQRSFVVATGGSIVTREREYRWLRDTTTTIWLRATPEDHWARVVAQGDARPMRSNPQAMEQLRQIHADREPLYRQAAHVVETSGMPVEGVVASVVSLVRQ